MREKKKSWKGKEKMLIKKLEEKGEGKGRRCKGDKV